MSAPTSPAAPERRSPTPPDPSRPVLISSWNGLPATARAVELYRSGTPLLAAIVAGTTIVEDDPEEFSVGYGGLPNEDCVVELDAAVMDGPGHRAGAVAALRGFRHAASVALEVLRRTDHTLLVGTGADKFARLLGFPEENLLTPKSREAWLAWKAQLSERDAWLSDTDRATDFGTALWAGKAEGNSSTGPVGTPKAPFTFGTIHTSGLDADGNLFAVTSTSGLSYKLAGRVGDTPVAGAGLYVDNDVGSAGATGRGEAVLQSCGGFAAVAQMESGKTPEEACLAVLKKIADRTREKRLLDTKGRPNFNVTMYALRKDGLTGSASIHEGYQHVVQRGAIGELRHSAFLFAKD